MHRNRRTQINHVAENPKYFDSHYVSVSSIHHSSLLFSPETVQARPGDWSTRPIMKYLEISLDLAVGILLGLDLHIFYKIRGPTEYENCHGKVMEHDKLITKLNS